MNDSKKLQQLMPRRDPPGPSDAENQLERTEQEQQKGETEAQWRCNTPHDIAFFLGI